MVGIASKARIVVISFSPEIEINKSNELFRRRELHDFPHFSTLAKRPIALDFGDIKISLYPMWPRWCGVAKTCVRTVPFASTAGNHYGSQGCRGRNTPSSAVPARPR